MQPCLVGDDTWHCESCHKGLGEDGPVPGGCPWGSPSCWAEAKRLAGLEEEARVAGDGRRASGQHGIGMPVEEDGADEAEYQTRYKFG